MACRPGLLRGGRSLRDLYTPSVGAPVGRDGESSRRPSGGPGRSRYTRHEVAAARVGRPRGSAILVKPQTIETPRQTNTIAWRTSYTPTATLDTEDRRKGHAASVPSSSLLYSK